MKLGLKHIFGSTALLAGLTPLFAHAETKGVAVGAQVSEVCLFNRQAPEMSAFLYLAFPEIDPSGNETFVRDASYKFRCSKDMRVRLLVGGKPAGPLVREMQGGSPSATLRYSLDWTVVGDIGGGFSPGSPELTLTLTGRLTPADYQDVQGAHYSDVVPISVDP